ncbi:hypothetical protein JRC04_05305 [Mycolicibacterium sp. S2-37]|uniref:hypothetical protein n=1 Tax=Mycolicibacterium sp. S2-37 TaxID=2810297 RepID=UPI001A953AB5|nr:hypothetical protein [Mycolicibacterium sp. S2-37]MBO0676872.1 hypothetical protein [Mycolicibacterium sp. S2-37]
MELKPGLQPVNLICVSQALIDDFMADLGPLGWNEHEVYEFVKYEFVKADASFDPPQTNYQERLRKLRGD